MARKSLIVKNEKIKLIIESQKEKRDALKKMVKNLDSSPRERFEAQLKLDALNRKGSPVKYVNRCSISGKKTGFLRRYGVSRNCIRELAFRGYIPGLMKDSW